MRAQPFPPEMEIQEEDYFDYYYDEPGSEPGSIIIDPEALPTHINLIEYNPIKAYKNLIFNRKIVNLV